MPITDEVIELSVEETNKLRAELGLAPLRLDNNDQNKQANSPLASPAHDNNPQTKDEEVLELSVDDTNKLRAKLGLPPLRTTSSSTTSKIQDAGLLEKQRKEEQSKLQEQKALKDDVERGIQTTFTAQPLSATAESDAKSWAAKLRSQQDDTATKKKKTKKQKGTLKYDEDDLKGLTVSHAMSELEAGSTTVMTLADAPLLETNEHNRHIVKGLASVEHALENVNLAEQAKQADGLRKKRQLEMGMGRAGGYAGFDDDEFVELGGSGVPSRTARRGLLSGNTGGSGSDDDDNANKKLKKGFRIGQDYDSAANKNNQSDLFAMEHGQAISLDPSHADVQASDFMTEEEALELDNTNKKEKKKSKKDKFEKKLKKKHKKGQKKHRRQQLDDDDDEDKEGREDETTNGKSGKKTLLEELEETAEDTTTSGLKKSRKRHRSDNDDDDNDDGDVTMKDSSQAFTTVETAEASTTTSSKLADKKLDEKENKRAKYNAIMDKGNERTQRAFGKKQPSKNADDNGLEEEPDDAFLNAALAKARRLKKLRDMSAATGADAVAESVRSMPDTATSSSAVANGGTSGGITFSVDDTREFTRALQARSEQQNRKQSKALAAAKKDAPSNTISTVTIKKIKQEPHVETVKDQGDRGEAKNDDDGDVDMAELAKEIKDDGDANNNGSFLDGTTGSTVSVGRGLAGVLNLFKQTGDLTRKNAGREELRGRAKDVRNYEDYEAMDLKSVVKIDERYATDKDREFATREVKLEYRDKHGRLLTKKEAFRDLCYQFHGHGSGKRKEEKRQKQVEREQAEKRFASQPVGSDGGPGTLGALKATQKATGKAFIVHKT